MKTIIETKFCEECKGTMRKNGTRMSRKGRMQQWTCQKCGHVIYEKKESP